MEVHGQPFHEELSPFTSAINEKTLHILSLKFSKQYAHLAKTSTEHFLTTPVTALPSGKEQGKFLSIDVGGTNMRVGFVQLLGEDGIDPGKEKIKRSHEKSWPIEEHLKMDQAEDLFAWIGDCIAEVILDAKNDPSVNRLTGLGEEDEVDLGVTFSFPMTQSSMSQATLMPMGKGFAITSDLNLGKMLLAGYSRNCGASNQSNGTIVPASPTSPLPHKRQRLQLLPKLGIAAIGNDTVSSFVSLAYMTKLSSSSRVAMGLIAGTGTNATIPMKLSSLSEVKQKEVQPNLPAGADPETQKIVINTEWTIRGTDLPMRELDIPTEWDKILDANCEAPGFQPFEYMTAGRYLGEIVRLCFTDLVSESDADIIPDTLLKKNAMATSFIAAVACSVNDQSIRLALKRSYGADFTLEQCRLLKAITIAVQIRSSALIASAIVGLLATVGEITLNNPDGSSLSESTTSPVPDKSTSKDQEELVVAYTGSLIQLFPNLLETCQAWIDHLVRNGSESNKRKRVVLKEAKDGGVIGAAVLAGMVAASGGVEKQY